MPLPRPKALSGINGEELVRSTSSETIHLSINDLHEERRRFEQYTREQNVRLGRLRELISEERAAASAELERRRAEIVAAGTDKLKAELDESRHLWQEQEQALARTQADYHVAQAEIQRVREQFEELSRRCRLHELAANEAAQLREELQRVTQEHAHHQRDSEAMSGVQSELAQARAEVERLRREKEEVHAQAAAQRRKDEEERVAIADKAQTLYWLARKMRPTQPST